MSTVRDEPTADLDDSRVLTPRAARVVRRSLFWIAVTTVAIILAGSMWALSRSGDSNAYLSAQSPGRFGAKALAEVLSDRGVDIRRADRLDSALGHTAAPEDTTILVFDEWGTLDRDAYERLSEAADRVVVVAPSPAALDAFAPGVTVSQWAPGPVVEADCGFAPVERAGRVSGLVWSYIVDDSDGGRVEPCLETDGDHSLISIDDGAVVLLGAGDALTNELIANDGNAALAVNLLGASSRLVWYLPALETDGVDLGSELTPRWLAPSIALAVLAVVALAVWRGRRLGPLVVESLPVVVRSSETMEGRARLYERTSARLRAADALRIGAVSRIARASGLARTASLDEVVASASALSGLPRREVRAMLVDDEPSSDRELVLLSDRITRLENLVAAAVRVGDHTPGE